MFTIFIRMMRMNTGYIVLTMGLLKKSFWLVLPKLPGFLILRKHVFEGRIQAVIRLLQKEIFHMPTQSFNGYDI